MARRRRDLESSICFHVTNRGADRQDIFSADIDRVGFEERIGDVVDEFELSLHAYALMSNHYHLVLDAPDGRLSDAMRELQRRHAGAYNLRTGRTGPLFGSRFVSVPISDDAHFLIECRYVHRNPLAITGTVNLAAYRWSSLGVYLGRRATPPWLSTSRFEALTDPATRLQRVLEPQPSDRLATGPLPPLVATSCAEIESAVETIVGGARSRTARMMIRTLAIELRCGDPVDLANRFGVTPLSLRTIARRGRERLATDPGFERLRQRVLAVLDDRTV